MTAMRRPPRRLRELNGTRSLTPEHVREFLWEWKVLDRPVKLPTEAEAVLTRRLDLVWDRFGMERTFDLTNATRRKILVGLGALRADIAALRGQQQNFLTVAEEALSASSDQSDYVALNCEVLRDRLREIDRLDALLAHISRAPTLEPSTNRAHKWQAYGLFLYGALQDALATVNISVGISAKGPAVRFFHGFIPYLTGETVTTESIATQLKTLRTKHR